MHNPDDPHAWSNFKRDLNGQCKLEWNTENLSKQSNFLDLTITIEKDGSISTRTYQKPMNLFLYIPANSAHPPGQLQSLVYGLMKTYLHQNSHWSDFTNTLNLLYRRLRARGHSSSTLNPLFMNAAAKLSGKSKKIKNERVSTTKVKKDNKKVFFHIPFHPKDISRREIQRIYTNTCEIGTYSFKCVYNSETQAHMRIPGITVAYSRLKNLRDCLTPSTLYETDNINVAKFCK